MALALSGMNVQIRQQASTWKSAHRGPVTRCPNRRLVTRAASVGQHWLGSAVFHKTSFVECFRDLLHSGRIVSRIKWVSFGFWGETVAPGTFGRSRSGDCGFDFFQA